MQHGQLAGSVGTEDELRKIKETLKSTQFDFILQEQMLSKNTRMLLNWLEKELKAVKCNLYCKVVKCLK